MRPVHGGRAQGGSEIFDCDNLTVVALRSISSQCYLLSGGNSLADGGISVVPRDRN